MEYSNVKQVKYGISRGGLHLLAPLVASQPSLSPVFKSSPPSVLFLSAGHKCLVLERTHSSMYYLMKLLDLYACFEAKCAQKSSLWLSTISIIHLSLLPKLYPNQVVMHWKINFFLASSNPLYYVVYLLHWCTLECTFCSVYKSNTKRNET